MTRNKSTHASEEGVPHPMDIALGVRIRTLRKERKMSQDQLAKEIGLTFQQIQKYEHGTNRISFSRLGEMAKALNLSVIDIIEPLVQRNGQAVMKATDHLVMLRDSKCVELLTNFSAIESPTRKQAVLRFVREMTRG